MESKSLLMLTMIAALAICSGCGEPATSGSAMSNSESASDLSEQIDSDSVELGPQSNVSVERSDATAESVAGAEATKANEPPPLDLPDDPNAVVDATFDHLKFDIEPDAEFDESMLTPTVHKLFDRNIRIRGYIYPTLKKRGLKQFILVRDNQECCFGPGAALFDCILVHMKERNTAEYSIRPVAVEGKFSLEVFPDPYGVTRAIYRLDGESVE